MSGKNPATLPHLASKKEYVRFMLPEKEWLLSVDIYVYTYTNIYIQHLGTQHDWQSKKLSDNSWSDFSQIPFIHHIFSKYPCGNPQKPLQIFLFSKIPTKSNRPARRWDFQMATPELRLHIFGGFLKHVCLGEDKMVFWLVVEPTHLKNI